jgi:hypothetical protein
MEYPLSNADQYENYNNGSDDEERSVGMTVADASGETTNVATPEHPRDESPQERAERAAAAAEVAVMEGANASRRTQRNPNADAALMGATGTEDAVAPLQTLDESGELVRQAFVEFLQN